MAVSSNNFACSKCGIKPPTYKKNASQLFHLRAFVRRVEKTRTNVMLHSSCHTNFPGKGPWSKWRKLVLPIFNRCYTTFDAKFIEYMVWTWSWKLIVQIVVVLKKTFLRSLRPYSTCHFVCKSKFIVLISCSCLLNEINVSCLSWMSFSNSCIAIWRKH